MQINKESINSKDVGISRQSWLGYGAEILTIFFALAVLTGRVYTESYWNVFGLSADFIDTNFVNYAIVSPNAVLASVLMAIGTAAMLAYFRHPIDIVGTLKPDVVYAVGLSFFWGGLFTIGMITKVDTSAWPNGTVGLLFGFAYLAAIGGQVIWI